MKRVLLTGGSGFTGRQTIPFLLDRGYEVHAVVHRGKPGILNKTEVSLHCCDLLDFPAQRQLFAEVKPSHLIHLAWYAEHRKFWSSPENIRWVQASLELLLNFAEQGGRRAVFAGTCAEYDWSNGYCSEKDTRLRPSTLYGICKNSLHEIVNRFSVQTGLSHAWARVFFLYGPHEHAERLVASVIRSLLMNRTAYCRHGDLVRDFLHVRDAASAFVSLLDSSVEGPVNIASGKTAALKDVVSMIAGKLDKRDLVRFGEGLPASGEPALLAADTGRIGGEVGWVPHYDLDRGLEHTIDWWKQNIQLNRTEACADINGE